MMSRTGAGMGMTGIRHEVTPSEVCRSRRSHANRSPTRDRNSRRLSAPALCMRSRRSISFMDGLLFVGFNVGERPGRPGLEHSSGPCSPLALCQTRAGILPAASPRGTKFIASCFRSVLNRFDGSMAWVSGPTPARSITARALRPQPRRRIEERAKSRCLRPNGRTFDRCTRVFVARDSGASRWRAAPSAVRCDNAEPT